MDQAEPGDLFSRLCFFERGELQGRASGTHREDCDSLYSILTLMSPLAATSGFSQQGGGQNSPLLQILQLLAYPCGVFERRLFKDEHDHT